MCIANLANAIAFELQYETLMDIKVIGDLEEGLDCKLHWKTISMIINMDIVSIDRIYVEYVILSATSLIKWHVLLKRAA